ncbi:MAG: extracellular solute-binding protein [Holosporales bacterium]|jgi:putrescine transport system substrate-binding protein|nr:extracellular solute-binding protein [Holosporales bacterium]
MRKLLKGLILIVVVATVVFLDQRSHVDDEHTLNVYGWHGIIPPSVIKNFEKETGIKVTYDVYDNNDTMEAKLIATGGVHDVVFPSFIPYAARQSHMGLFKKLNYAKLPNFCNISKSICSKIAQSGRYLDYLIPFFWGTVGVAINKEIVYEFLPNVDVNSYDIILNPENLKVLSKQGVSFPEEFTDIFPQVMVYLRRDPNTRSKENLKAFADHFKKIRKYITKFSSTTIVNDLLTENICIGIGSSDCINKAVIASKGKDGKAKIKSISLNEGGLLWVDCICIPKSARHTENAYKFINYMMRKDVCLRITRYSGIQIMTNSEEEEKIKSMIFGAPSKNSDDMDFDKAATRAWTKIRLNNFEDD